LGPSDQIVLQSSLLLIGVLMWFVPVMKGPDAFFGIPVSELFYRGPLARRYLLIYRAVTTVLVAGAMAVLAGARARVFTGPGLVLGAFCAGIMGPGFALIPFWYAVRPHEERGALAAGGPAELVPPRSKWVYVVPWVQAFSFAALLAAIGLTMWRYPQLPASIPTHWDIAGRANGWMTKGIVSVAFPLVMMGLMQGLCLWLLVGIAQVPERLPRERVDEYRVARERYLRMWAVWTNLMQLAMVLVFGGIVWASLFGVESQARGATPPGMFALFIGIGALLLSLPWLIVKVLRHRAELREIVGPGAIESLAPTEGWLWGSIYYNRSDPSVWVEKRLGIGWTLNMARPASWVFFALVLGLPIGFAIFAAAMSGK